MLPSDDSAVDELPPAESLAIAPVEKYSGIVDAIEFNPALTDITYDTLAEHIAMGHIFVVVIAPGSPPLKIYGLLREVSEDRAPMTEENEAAHALHQQTAGAMQEAGRKLLDV